MKTKRLIIFLLTLTLMLPAAMAKTKENSRLNFTAMGDMKDVSYVHVGKKMLQVPGLMVSYGITPALTSELKSLQIIMVDGNSKSLDEVRKMLHKVTDTMSEELTVKRGNNNIKLWVEATDDDDTYENAIIGVGGPGKLTYIIFEGKIDATALGFYLGSL